MAPSEIFAMDARNSRRSLPSVESDFADSYWRMHVYYMDRRLSANSLSVYVPTRAGVESFRGRAPVDRHHDALRFPWVRGGRGFCWTSVVGSRIVRFDDVETFVVLANDSELDSRSSSLRKCVFLAIR
jgi:hypothetical protein